MWKYRKGLLLINASAGSDYLEKKLKQALPTLSIAIKNLQVVHTETLEEMKEILIDQVEHIDLLVILGGDGTIHEIMNVLGTVEKRPVVGILPGGTSNDFSRTLGIPQNIMGAAKVIAEGNERHVDLAQSDSRYFLNFWGIGLIAHTSDNIDEEEKNQFGVLSYFISTMRSINQVEPFAYKVTADEKEVEGEAVLIVAFNGRYIGTREVGLTTIRPDDGKLDVLIVKESSLASLREILSAVNPYSQNESFEEIVHFQTNKLEVQTSEPRAIDMDGEIQEKTPSTIVVLPRFIRMLSKRESGNKETLETTDQEGEGKK